MGQKINPISFRINYTKDWPSKWCTRDRKAYIANLHNDIKIREILEKELRPAGLSRVKIERFTKKITINIPAAKPGIIIGRKGSDIEKIKAKLLPFVGSDELSINIVEIRKPDLEAQVAADGLSASLEKRVSFRKGMKKVIQSALKQGALGIKVACSGRLGGAEIARTEWYREGKVPLHTLRADISYATSIAQTTYGVIGVKVWIYRPSSN